MPTTTLNTCPDCGTTYPNNDFGGMCPGCLLLGLGDEGEDGALQLPDLAGMRIGRYVLVEKLGEGGMGSVWKARQDEPVEREVALKLIKPGMDTRAVLARFEAERQVLARLDHPNIAKIFDAGATEAGRPYYVMELVDGLPITDYCEQHQLSTDERLALFNQICKAVQHAHDQGVVHRDLKPSNILVADHAEGRLKVIDFGIAKAAGETFAKETLLTHEGQIVGTPGYMSPEQAEGAAEIDGRSDVYSLGALLYEMLSGTPPFTHESLRDAGMLEVVRIIKEVEPPKPSTRLDVTGAKPQRSVLKIAGALDWIALKALAKDPSKRYASPSDLAQDITRHLRREPVSATSPGPVQRMAKWVGRHRAACTTVATAAVVAAITLLASRLSAPPATAIPGPEVEEPIKLTPGPPVELWKLIAGAPTADHFRVEGDTIHLLPFSHPHRPLFLPIQPAGSYRLDMTITKEKTANLYVVLPIGDRLLNLELRREAMIGLRRGYDNAESSQSLLAAAGLALTQFRLAVVVVWDPAVPEPVSVSISADGDEILDWSGSTGELPVAAADREMGIEMFSSFFPSSCKRAELRELSVPPVAVNLPDPEARTRSNAAREILASTRASLEISYGGAMKKIFAPGKIPDTPFQVSKIKFHNAALDPSEQIPHILAFPELTHLALRGAFRDADIARLGVLHELSFLGLQETEITGSGIRELRGFPALRRIEIADCHRIDGALDLSNLQSLQQVRVHHSLGITDVRPLAANQNLIELNLHSTPITDAGLNFPTPTPRLQALYVDHTAITRDSLESIKRLSTLTNFRTTAPFRPELEALQRTLPNCAVTLVESGEGIDFPALSEKPQGNAGKGSESP